MCRVLQKLLIFLLRKVEEYLDAQLKKTVAKMNREIDPSAKAKKLDLVGTIILLITSIGLMISSYLLTSFILTLTQ